MPERSLPSRPGRTRHSFGVLALVLAAGGLPRAALHAQSRGAESLPRSVVSGEVVDAESTQPVEGATVVLEPAEVGALPGPPGSGSAFLPGARSTVTGAAGRYRFAGIAPGSYRLHVQRLGYRPATLGLELRPSADSRVSVGLNLDPVALQPVEVSAAPPQRYGYGHTPASDEERLAAVRARQALGLAADVREITHAEVVEAVTLGETDLFRALQRLPGVTTRDDYTAELWVRGAPWDQTRVYFDGLPLFNPVHGIGVFGAINPHAVGAAFLHPGVRSAALGEGAAGVLDVQSRRGGSDDGDIKGAGEISLVSARLALEDRSDSGRYAWMLAARRTYFDLLSWAYSELADDPYAFTPYDFSDLSGRFDWAIGGGRTLEASGIWEQDRITGNVSNFSDWVNASWGNAAARVTLGHTASALHGRHTLGVSRYRARIHQQDLNIPPDERVGVDPSRLLGSSVRHTSLKGEWEPQAKSGSRPPWSGGYEVVAQRTSFDGPPPSPYAGDIVLPHLDLGGSLVYGVLWGEHTWTLADRLALRGGVRLEGGPRVANGGVLRTAPRLSARYQPHPDIAFSLGLGRSFQYGQAVLHAGPILSEASRVGQLWLLADHEFPALRADIATFGAEHWLGDGWLAAVAGFYRHSVGVAVPDPAPGAVMDRPLWVAGENTARGTEISVRRIAGRWTASAAYTYGISEMEASGFRYPAAQDRRHLLDLTTMLRATQSFRTGAAFTYASGAPFTRVLEGVPAYPQTAGRPWEKTPRAEAPNAERTSAYASLDLLADWSWKYGERDVGAYVQLRNALGRKNAITYTGSVRCEIGYGYCDPRSEPAPGRSEANDYFEDGMPTVPVFGFRIAF